MRPAAWFRQAVQSTGVFLICLALLSANIQCGTGQPQGVLGPPTTNNIAPTLSIFEPSANQNLNQGERFTIQWTDADQDSAARIQFVLQSVDTGFEILIVSNIPENDSEGPDEFSVNTSLVPLGKYFVRGEITDGVNTAVSTYATLEGTATRVQLNIGERGVNPLNVPPRVAVVEPSFNQGVAQDDNLHIEIFPTAAGAGVPYDPDSTASLYVLLDLDEDPTNDNPQLPDPNQIILLRPVQQLEAGNSNGISIDIPIDLAQVPARPNGLPYFIRATIVDDSNPPVHDYADGAINIVRSATGTVDLARVGTEFAGARVQGFNPGSWLGTTMTGIGDFDADGVDDFLLVARYGNPRNFGNIGEAYVIYGLNRQRFGGAINVNSVSTTVSGVIIEAPPNRLNGLRSDPLAVPQGITSASFIPDLSGDGRPEILLGMSLVDGMYQGRDDDPGDSPGSQEVSIRVEEDNVTREINNTPDSSLSDEFNSTIDTYISRTAPQSSFGSSNVLRISATQPVSDANPGDEFTLIGYSGASLLNLLTTRDPEAIQNLNVILELHLASGILPQPAQIEAHPLLQGFNNDVTYADFGADGTPGPTSENEYASETLPITINFLDGTLQVDVTDTITALLEGNLGAAPGWIIIPKAVASGVLSSSEGLQGSRPTLLITYEEPRDDAINIGCYPDTFVNNQSDQADDPGDGLGVDSTLESLGAVFMINSENRDSDPAFSDATRLDSTEVACELVGQEEVGGGIGFSTSSPVPGDSQTSGTIRQLARDAEVGLTRGTRFTSGPWEYINGGDLGRATPRHDRFGDHVASMPDINNDRQPDIIISSPRNELYLEGLDPITGPLADSTISFSTVFDGSIWVVVAFDFSTADLFNDPEHNTNVPRAIWGRGDCPSGIAREASTFPSNSFEIFAEDSTDWLGGAEYAGDVNLDSVPDLVCGAPLNDYNGRVDSGAMYIVYGRRPVGNVRLNLLDDPGRRPPTLRVRGDTAGDRVGTRQVSGLDINGDRVDDVFFSSATVDFGGVRNNLCGDFDQNGVVDANDLRVTTFNSCRANLGTEVFSDDACKAYDYDNDRDIDDDDRRTFDCLVGGFSNCCPVDNGYIGIIFGDIQQDGDRSISQLATTDLPGIILYGANAGDRAGTDIVSAGDFNRDGYGDLLISAPGVRFTDSNNRDRVGVAYLIFGGTHLNGNRTFSLDQVGTSSLPGVVLWSPFVSGRPNEAPIEFVGALGDINGDGFDDISVGLPHADFLDQTLPQDPNDPGTNPNIGRRPDDGNVYIIYGNNTTQ
jgi:hypothetical protein